VAVDFAETETQEMRRQQSQPIRGKLKRIRTIYKYVRSPPMLKLPDGMLLFLDFHATYFTNLQHQALQRTIQELPSHDASELIGGSA
jgi:hypothetical protein